MSRWHSPYVWLTVPAISELFLGAMSLIAFYYLIESTKGPRGGISGIGGGLIVIFIYPAVMASLSCLIGAGLLLTQKKVRTGWYFSMFGLGLMLIDTFGGLLLLGGFLQHTLHIPNPASPGILAGYILWVVTSFLILIIAYFVIKLPSQIPKRKRKGKGNYLKILGWSELLAAGVALIFFLTIAQGLYSCKTCTLHTDQTALKILLPASIPVNALGGILLLKHKKVGLYVTAIGLGLWVAVLFTAFILIVYVLPETGLAIMALELIYGWKNAKEWGSSQQAASAINLDF